MKKIRSINVLLFLLLQLPALLATGQTKAKSASTGTNGADSSLLKTKTAKYQQQTDDYIHIASTAKQKFKSLFPSKGDTVYILIPGITYSDVNLQLLKQQIDDVKSTKGLTCSYKNGNAIVKVLYKGDASKLYDQLSEDIRNLFVAGDIEGTRMILDYKDAKSTESSVEKKLIIGNTNQ